MLVNLRLQSDDRILIFRMQTFLCDQFFVSYIDFPTFFNDHATSSPPKEINSFNVINVALCYFLPKMFKI